ncbi:hypothetical protein TI39_contig4099g00021 [Zymoseptoria brevis]|uniref:Uncharacterized protein n=1 Tax=Zymoseptoria brevis TaxID=1047168 RepID=A0A0F4GHJ5_9PEZI|nr:hypothetical protein TI39_contig4099g00021 [Zymoseptoria brevis]
MPAVLGAAKKGTSSVASAITTPTTPKASALTAKAGASGPQISWANVARPPAAQPDMRRSVLRPRPSHTGGQSMISQMRGLSVNDNPGNPNVYNPSVGPLGTQGNPWGWTTVESNMTAETSFLPVKNDVCIRSKHSVRDFRKGEVLALPFHVPNMNPNLDPNERRLKMTCEGPAFSKRRMFVILWINQLDMFCLPLYSFQGKGLAAKKDYQRFDYVCLKNKGVAGATFKNLGKYDPVVFESYNKCPMTDETTVHLTGGISVDPRENISLIGRLDEQSHKHLAKLWQDRVDESKNKPWGRR